LGLQPVNHFNSIVVLACAVFQENKMDDLNDLIRALVTVFVRYRYSQPRQTNNTNASETEWTVIEKPVNETSTYEQEQVDELMTKPNNELLLALSTLIDDSTQKYETRKSLLVYLQYIVQLLKENQRPADLHTGESNETDQQVQASVVTLLSNLKLLYNTTQFNNLLVTYNKQTVNLRGFSFSNSLIAQQIQTLIMEPLEITATTTEHTLQLQVNCLFLKQQVAVALEVHAKNRLIEEENSKIRQDNHQLTEQLKEEQSKVPQKNATIQQNETLVTPQPLNSLFRAPPPRSQPPISRGLAPPKALRQHPTRYSLLDILFGPAYESDEDTDDTQNQQISRARRHGKED